MFKKESVISQVFFLFVVHTLFFVYFLFPSTFSKHAVIAYSNFFLPFFSVTSRSFQLISLIVTLNYSYALIMSFLLIDFLRYFFLAQN